MFTRCFVGIYLQTKGTKMTQKSLSIQEAKTMLGIGTTKFYQLINSGELRAHKIGKRTIVLRSDLEEFISNLKSYPSKKAGV